MLCSMVDSICGSRRHSHLKQLKFSALASTSIDAERSRDLVRDWERSRRGGSRYSAAFGASCWLDTT